LDSANDRPAVTPNGRNDGTQSKIGRLWRRSLRRLTTGSALLPRFCVREIWRAWA